MRAVIQRVREASVTIDGEVVGQIEHGFLVLLGIHVDDTAADADYMADKIVNLRIFNDHEAKMNVSLLETGGSALIVSQFTLYGDARRGRRPSFIEAARGSEAEALYETVCQKVASFGVSVARGRFGAMMDVGLLNDGPVTILLDSRKGF